MALAAAESGQANRSVKLAASQRALDAAVASLSAETEMTQRIERIREDGRLTPRSAGLRRDRPSWETGMTAAWIIAAEDLRRVSAGGSDGLPRTATVHLGEAWTSGGKSGQGWQPAASREGLPKGGDRVKPTQQP